MSTREMALNIVENMSEEQLKSFIILFKDLVPIADIPNDETKEAMAEVEDMKQHPEKYKGYDDIDLMFKEMKK